MTRSIAWPQRIPLYCMIPMVIFILFLIFCNFLQSWGVMLMQVSSTFDLRNLGVVGFSSAGSSNLVPIVSQLWSAWRVETFALVLLPEYLFFELLVGSVSGPGGSCPLPWHLDRPRFLSIRRRHYLPPQHANLLVRLADRQWEYRYVTVVRFLLCRMFSRCRRRPAGWTSLSFVPRYGGWYRTDSGEY